MKNQILQGDVIEVAKGLPDQSVNMIMTSPPYWRLRDYQTGKWEGGDEGCDHIRPALGGSGKETINGPTADENGTRFQQYRSTCAKCGAARIDQQIGLEETPEAYVAKLVEAFRELRRVLRDDGTVWLNLGDSYASNPASGGTRDAMRRPQDKNASPHQNTPNFGYTRPDNLKPKDLVGIPWMVAFALRADGWYLRSEIIWHKLNPMPESVTDRPTKAHEQIFLLTKSPRYYYDQDAIREPVANGSGGGFGPTSPNGTMRNDTGRPRGDYPQGRNRRTVWSVPEATDPLLSYLLMQLAADEPDKLLAYLDQYTNDASLKKDIFTVSSHPYKGAHFATFPPALIEPCILAGCPAQVCVECGQPWVRAVEKEKGIPDNFNGSSFNRGKTYEAQSALAEVGEVERTIKIKTLHFAPTCQCCPLPATKSATRPGVVLDPFFGSGTVAEVAIDTGRDWLGIELNPDYIELAKDRIYATQPALFAR